MERKMNMFGEEHSNINRADYLLLTTLYAAECKDHFHSMTIAEMIADNLDEDDNHPLGAKMTIYKRLQRLVEKGYISKGVKDDHADTYFIKEKTIKMFEG